MLWLKTHLKTAHSRSHPVVRQDNFAVSIRHLLPDSSCSVSFLTASWLKVKESTMS